MFRRVGSLRGWITAVGLVLAVAIGLIGGILLQQYMNFDTVQRRLERQRARAAYDARRRDPKQWAIDSARWAASALWVAELPPAARDRAATGGRELRGEL